MKTYIVDTNVIIRYLVADDKKLFLKAKEIFDKAKSNQHHLVVETYVFTEAVYVLSSFYKVPKEKIAEVLKELVAYKGIMIEHNLIIQALEIYEKTNMHIVDCLLAAKAKINSYSITTFDQELNNFIR